jgi:hypothetical protein
MTDNRTTELREKLTERGVEHSDYDVISEKLTRWGKSEEAGWGFCYSEVNLGNRMLHVLRIYDCTPEQAIAATLGGDDEYEAKMDALLCRLTNGKWSKTRQYSLEFMESCVNEEYECNELTAEQVREAWTGNLKRDCLYDPPMPDWQAIAEELNALLGSEHHAYEQRITGDGSDWGEIMRNAYDGLMVTACESCTPEQVEQLSDYIRAELGSGTCGAEVRESAWGGYTRHCGNCGADLDCDTRNKQRFCPSCGKRIREAVE